MRSVTVWCAAWVLLASAACERGGERSAAAQKRGGGGNAAAPLPILVVQAEPADVERWYEGSGTLRAIRTAQIRPRQSGVVDELYVEEGSQVKEGDLLARLDAKELALMAARDRVTASNQLDQASRLESIAGTGAISEEEIRLQRNAAEQAKASAKLSRHQAKLTQVRAPFSGTVLKRLVDLGTLAGTGTAMFELADLSQLEVDLHVPEREALAVADGARAELHFLDGSSSSAALIRRAPMVEAATGTVKMTLRLSQPPATALPGAFVRASLLLESQTAVPSLPSSALFEVEGKPHVWVVREGMARRQAIEIGLRGGARVELVGGLPQGAWVIEDAAGGLSEGMPLAPLDREGKEIPGLGPPAAARGDGDGTHGSGGADAKGGKGRHGGRGA